MVDRLNELRDLARQKNVSVPPLGPASAGRDLEAQRADAGGTGGAGGAEQDASFMADYFQKIGRLKTSIGTVRHNVDKIRSLKQAAIQATSPENEKGTHTHTHTHTHMAASQSFDADNPTH